MPMGMSRARAGECSLRVVADLKKKTRYLSPFLRLTCTTIVHRSKGLNGFFS